MALTNPLEISIHRKNTKRFIDADATKIALIPKGDYFIDGTKVSLDQPPRAEQTFKIIWMGETGVIREVNDSGGVKRFDFVLVGEYDAIVEIGDHWFVDGQIFVIEYIYPFNDYEVKAGGVTHGSRPNGL